VLVVELGTDYFHEPRMEGTTPYTLAIHTLDGATGMQIWEYFILLFKLRTVPWLGGQSPTSVENWAQSQASQSEICGGRNSNIGTGFSHCKFSGQYYPTHARYSLTHSDVIAVRQTRFRAEHICL